MRRHLLKDRATYDLKGCHFNLSDSSIAISKYRASNSNTKNNCNNRSLNISNDSKPETGDKKEATSTDRTESGESNQQTIDRKTRKKPRLSCPRWKSMNT
ncbi:hypothetical protein Bca52824_021777 [Brassica carinata]|uniref:Uncharacterized protein n=1 Tax=Brassica carinata TaxID=52824 RepID=A0A8X7VEZ7_BRACI|nr:hypothetical protein Bca52824_021777 [Brassica carinata]